MQTRLILVYNSTDDTWTITLGSGLTISASQSVTFDGTTQIGNGTFPDYGGKIIVLTPTTISAITGGSGSDVTIKRITFQQTSATAISILAGIGANASSTVQNCYFFRSTIPTGTNRAVSMGGTTGNVTFTNNKVENFLRALDASSADPSVVVDIENNVLVNIPSIGFNVTGYNSIVKNNSMDYSDQGIRSSCSGGTCIIDNNTLTGTASGFASIVLLGAGTFSVTNNNINTNNSRAISLTSGATISGNTIQGGGGAGDGKILVQTADVTKAVTISGNTITVSNAIPIRVVSTGSRAHISNNVITSTFGYTPIQLAGGTEDANLVTANDPGDTDTGPNSLMNFPVITFAQDIGGGKFRIKGTMDYNPSEAPITIELYKSDNEGSGHGGALAYVGSVTPNTDGTWDTEVSVSGDTWSNKMWFSATATNASGDTSEFSQNLGIGGSEPQQSYSTCQEKGPTSPPVLYGAVGQSTSSILLYFTAPKGDYTYYFLEYGTKSNKYFFGNPNIGFKPMSTYLVKGLSPGTKYYFRVGARNGCAAGGWSNEWSGVTLGGKESETKNESVPTPTPSVGIGGSSPTVNVENQKESIGGIRVNSLKSFLVAGAGGAFLLSILVIFRKRKRKKVI